MRDILFVAGEASGDMHAAGVAAEIRRREPTRRMLGIGGDRMLAEGVELIEHVEQLAVMGFVEVIRHVPHHWELLRRIKVQLESGRVGLVVLIDYPGFNLKVATAARALGIPVLYYVTPQVWAWGANRLPKIARVVSKAACILPFEEPLLKSHGIDATFVGHPLLDRALALPSQSEARRTLGVDADGPLLAMFPGSRRAELARHLDDFVATAKELVRRQPALRVIVSVAPTVRIDASVCPFPLVRDASFTVLRAATAGLLKSGTTTLEAAVAGLPHVVAYRTSALSYAIARRVVKIPHIGLVNVVAEREVSREFVQHDLKPARVADALEPLLDVRSETRAEAEAGLALVRSRLGTPGAASRVADMALTLVT